jgi:hypothetical protein
MLVLSVPKFVLTTSFQLLLETLTTVCSLRMCFDVSSTKSTEHRPTSDC